MATDKSTTDTKAKKAPAKTRAKRKQKRNIAQGNVHIQATFNNTIITVSDRQGNVLASSSAGATGFRGSKKGTAYAAQIASEQALTKAVNDYGMAKADVFVKGVGLGREAAIRAIQGTGMVVESITDITPVPHGGVRPRNPRKG